MPAPLQDILRIEVPVIVQIAERRLRLKEVTNLAPGSIVELPKRADEQLEILVNNKVIGRGVAVKVGENFGIRVNHVGQLDDRIQAIGAASGASAGPRGNARGGSSDDLDLDALLKTGSG
jgi:flagellar motor switch protein FliN/FliY